MIGMKHLANGVINFRDLIPISVRDEDVQRYRVSNRELIFNRTNSLDLVGKTSISVGVPHDRILFASYLVRIHTDENRLLPEFANYFMNSHIGVTRIKTLATPGVGQYNVNPTSLRNQLLIPLPPIPEQQKIAAILSTWDRAIELTEKLIAAKQKRKQALMQQLLTGKVRLPRVQKNAWKKCHLGDVAKNSTRRNGSSTDQATVYSVTNSVGMIPMDEGVIGESIDRYKTVSRFDFAYNPMRINVGSIAMWDGDKDVLVSPDYVVFRCGSKLNAEFLNHFRRTHYWRHFVNRAGGGSVRVRIYFSDLAAMKLNLPPVEEQQAIAAVLNAQNAEIELFGRRLAALKQQKKGLMQQLLTGKVRVNVDAEMVKG
jgi:type I restriction enzyme S subunit